MATNSQGLSQFSISGVQYDVVGNMTWNVETIKRERQVSLQGVENVTSYEPVAAKISVTIRWLYGVPPSAILNTDGLTINAVTRNGLTIVGRNAFVSDVITNNPVELTSELEFSCESIEEIVN